MKKLLIMLLVWTVILPLSASAQRQYRSIEEMIRNTPDRWTGTYETSRGTVSVDVPVELPTVNVFPVIKAGKMPAVEAEKLKDYGYVRRNIAGNLTVDQKKYIWETGTRTKDVHIYRNGEIPLEQAENVSLTYEETLTLFRQETERLWGLTEQDCIVREARIEGPAYHFTYKKGVGEEPTDDMIIWGEQAADAGRYRIWFNQLFHGIEVNGGTFSMLYSDLDGIKIRAALYDELEVVENDVPLLPFEALKSILESQITAGRLCSIDTIKLGYYRYLDAKDRNTFWLLPAWYITGTCIRDEKTDGMIWTGIPESLEMVIQAQTGALCDIRGADDAPRTASAIIAWKDLENSN